MISFNTNRFLFFLTLVFLISKSYQQNNNTILSKDLRTLLPSGDSFPMVGFGTSTIVGTEFVKNTLDQALAAGYRLFDSAQIYGNEEDIGKALKELLPKHNLTRKDVFITSKLAAREDSLGNKAYAALEKSFKNLNLEYIDLYMILFPGVPPADTEHSSVNYSKLRDETWEQLVKGVKNGLVRNIGVSNYNVRHLTEVVNNNHGVPVAVNQVEWHPLYHQDDVLEFCKKNGIILQAYFSLGGKGNSQLLNNPEVKKIADKLGKNSAQILLRWAVQQNIAVIPKTSNKKHMETNIDLNFQIPDSDMKILSGLRQEQKLSWNPDNII